MNSAEIKFCFNGEPVSYKVDLDFRENIFSFLRRLLKRDDLVLQVGVIKDDTFLTLSRYNEVLSEGYYRIFFPQKNETPSEYNIQVSKR